MNGSSISDGEEAIARFVKARVTDRILCAPTAAEAIALVADAAPGEVVVLDLAADLIAASSDGEAADGEAADGEARRVVPAQVDLATTLAAVDSELGRCAAALLIVPGVGERTGDVLPLPKLAAIAHRRGARLLVDGSELVSRRAVNLTSHGIDYLVLSGSAVAGPAVVVGRADWLASSGETATCGAGALGPACRGVIEFGHEWAGLHEQTLSEVLDAAVDQLPGVRRLRLWPDTTDRVGIASLAVVGREEPVVVRWGSGTGPREFAQQVQSLADVVLEQEKS